MEYTKGELRLVSETEYEHIIYLRDKPNRGNKIVSKFAKKDDALLASASGDMYEALKGIMADLENYLQPYILERTVEALAKAEGK